MPDCPSQAPVPGAGRAFFLPAGKSGKKFFSGKFRFSESNSEKISGVIVFTYEF